MIREYSNEFGKVFVVSENTFILEKYYDKLDELYNDEYSLIGSIYEMDFNILKKTIYSFDNKWMVKFDLEYSGD
tara:strand:- start:5702 stop:5923 length:222 start_codon:yes stop_codon:yes gene_type:complete